MFVRFTDAITFSAVGETLIRQISALLASSPEARDELLGRISHHPEPLVVVALSEDGPLGVAFGFPGGQTIAAGVHLNALQEVAEAAAWERWPRKAVG